MAYEDFQVTETYSGRLAGASVAYFLINALDPTDVVVGKVRGLNSDESFESLPVEEAGNDGVDEIVQGRHGPGRVTLPGFLSPQFNDRLPTRQTFIGKKYVIMAKIAEGYPEAGKVLNVWEGCRLDAFSTNGDARGLVGFNLAFMFTRRFNGTEWAELTGT